MMAFLSLINEGELEVPGILMDAHNTAGGTNQTCSETVS
jgi:hypothetical protein